MYLSFNPRALAFSLLTSGLYLLAPVREADAYCTLPRHRYAFFDRQTCSPQKEIHVYINVGQVNIARLGLPIDDIERLVRAAIAAYNESGATLPRLTYGGRVFHDTRWTLPDGVDPVTAVQAYKQAWVDQLGPDRPFGITIQADLCPDRKPRSVANTLALSVPGNVGFETITFNPFWDDNQVVCPRGTGNTGGSVNCASQSNPEATPGTACPQPGDTAPCACTAGPPGEHRCELSDNDQLVWSGCFCTERTYQAYNLGDGTSHPEEPDTCDALGPGGTKDFLGVLMHEMGHALGMNHSQFAGVDECGEGLLSLGNTQGIMRTAADEDLEGNWHVVVSKGRRPHADDLAGLRAFFAWLEVPWRQDFQISFYESDDAGLTWGSANLVQLPTSGVRTRPAVTSATDDSGFQAIAFANSFGEVFHLGRDGGVFQALSPEQAKVPDAVTYFPVAVAHGADRLMIAWLHHDGFFDRRTNIRWAIRDTEFAGNVTWTLGDHWSQVNEIDDNFLHKEIGLAYDPGINMFVVAAINSFDYSFSPFPDVEDGKPLFFAVDPATAQVYAPPNPTGELLDSLPYTPCGHPAPLPGGRAPECGERIQRAGPRW